MQQDSALPVYFHPSLTVVVDDSQLFVESLGFQMDPSRAMLAFNDPDEALAWLRQWHSLRMPGFLPVRVTHDDLTFSSERRTIQLDVDRVYRQIHEVNRFLQPSVIVVDYSMPRMNGLEFCAKLKELPCMTILLTGMADENIAVQGFNDGLIDRYIKKDHPAMAERLGAEIEALQMRYFSRLSSTLRELLSRHSFSFLSDPAVMQLVRELSARYRFIEYYLYPHPAGVLLLTADGRATLMVIETNASMLTHLENAEAYNAPDELLKGLHNKQIVPFFWPGDGMYTPACVEWEQYCLPAEVCQGREPYYYALFDMPSHLLPAQVYSYTQFLANYKQDPDALTGRKPR